MTEHTAGPWKANRSGNGVTVTVMTPEGQLLIKANGIPPRGAMDANARLIAAAPELLEACKALMTLRDYLHILGPGSELVFNEGAQAIAKAV